MKTITINEALLALKILEELYPKMKPEQKFKVDKVRAILRQSLELAMPLATGEEKRDQWLNKATTLPFEPLVLADVFKGFKKLTPEDFLAIKRLCV
jgi:hypothetical protein